MKTIKGDFLECYPLRGQTPLINSDFLVSYDDDNGLVVYWLQPP